MSRVFLVVGDIERRIYEPLVSELRRKHSGIKIVHMTDEIYRMWFGDFAIESFTPEELFERETGHPPKDFFAFVMTAATYLHEIEIGSIRTVIESKDLRGLSYGYVVHPEERVEVVLSS